MEWLYDDITPRGLSFDGSMPTACKTARGRFQGSEWDYDLIHPPEKMIAFQRQEKENNGTETHKKTERDTHALRDKHTH